MSNLKKLERVRKFETAVIEESRIEIKGKLYTLNDDFIDCIRISNLFQSMDMEEHKKGIEIALPGINKDWKELKLKYSEVRALVTVITEEIVGIHSDIEGGSPKEGTF